MWDYDSHNICWWCDFNWWWCYRDGKAKKILLQQNLRLKI